MGLNMCNFPDLWKTGSKTTINVEGLSAKYPSDNAVRGAKFKFMWMDVETEVEFRQLFNVDLETTTLPSVAVVNPHKKFRFKTLRSTQEAD